MSLNFGLFICWLSLAAVGSFPALANSNNIDPSTQLSIPADEAEAEESKFSAYATYDHYLGFRDNMEASGVFYFSGSYQFEDGKIEVFQPVSKYYVVNPGAPEVEAADTQIRHYTEPLELSKDWKLQLRSELTVPISNFSREQDVITKPAVQGRLNTKAWGDLISISLRPSFRYYVNTYKTTVSGLGAGGGRPLRLWQGGVSLLVGLDASDRLSFLAMLGYDRVEYEKVKFYNADPIYGESDFPQHRYIYSLSGEYSLIPDKWSAGVGYSHDSIVEQRGGIEYTLYDDTISTWNLTTSIYF